MISGIYSGVSALKAIATKTQSVANNTANINTDGYKKTRVTLKEGAPQQGVTADIHKIETPGPLVYEQTQKGVVQVEKSNVDIAEEIPQLLLSRRNYQANLKTIQVEDEMLGMLLDIKG